MNEITYEYDDETGKGWVGDKYMEFPTELEYEKYIYAQEESEED